VTYSIVNKHLKSKYFSSDLIVKEKNQKNFTNPEILINDSLFEQWGMKLENPIQALEIEILLWVTMNQRKAYFVLFVDDPFELTWMFRFFTSIKWNVVSRNQPEHETRQQCSRFWMASLISIASIDTNLNHKIEMF
jgi:hypothetical protein